MLLVLLCIICLVALIVSFNFRNKNQEEPKNGSVIIDNKYIDGFTAEIYPQKRARLSFFVIAQELGAVVEKKGDLHFWVTYDSNVYVLDFSNGISFMKQGEEDNKMMIPLPGGIPCYYKLQANDVIVDDVTLHGMLYFMEIPTYFSVEYDTHPRVEITTR